MPFLHQVLGSGAADGPPGHRGVDADAKWPACSQLGNKTFCFWGVCSGQHTLRTGLVKPPHSQLGVERILRLTKVKRSFQSTQDAGGGPRSACGRDAQGHMGTPGVASAPDAGGAEGGSKAQSRWWVPRFRAAAGSWAPPVATPTQRATGLRSARAGSAPLQELHVCPLPSQERLVLKFLNGKLKQVRIIRKPQ